MSTHDALKSTIDLRRAWCMSCAPVAVLATVAALVVARQDSTITPVQGVSAVLVLVWTTAGVALGVRRRHERLAPIVLAGSIVGALALLGSALDASERGGDAAAVIERIALAALPALGFHFLSALPDGRLGESTRVRLAVFAYASAVVVALVLSSNLDDVMLAPLAVAWAAAAGGGVVCANPRYRAAGAEQQRRMQWIGWGLTIAAEGALVVGALHLLAGWPPSPGVVALAFTVAVPLAVVAGTVPRLIAHVDRLLTRTVELTGLTALVLGVYIVVMLGFGRTPKGSERSLLLLSMAAATIAALAYLPARSWLTERANRLVYGERVAPDQALRTFGQRLTRAVPLDELMLQLCENLRKSMALSAAEVWTGEDGIYERAAGVPHRHPPPIEIAEKERSVVARAGVSGGTWLDIWIPALVGDTGSSCMRVAPVAHSGLLLGFIVATRRPDGEAFSESDDTVLTDLARQLGLALHNAQLDTALQDSMVQLRDRNRELQESRARIVAAGDAERRKLERNLHDGAQQHLVALAVKLRLARDSIEDDPADAMAMIDEIKGDVQDAIGELRALAHGIFPPLLVSGGLPEALPAAAGRAALPARVEVDGVGRYGNDVEAAVYFCALEALQNAGKHAGEGASAVVRVVDDGSGQLCFEIRDDGAGFDPSGAMLGHGFVNMADRLGAFGGTIEVTSAPGAGTTVTGTIPLPDPSGS